jgi:hypothetical protein
MRAMVRRAVGGLATLVLVGAGLMAGAVPASADRGTISGSSGSTVVTAQLFVPNDTHHLRVWLDHNGTAADLTSAMVSVTGPSGELVYSRQTSFEPSATGWSASDFELPRPLELGRYQLSFDGEVTVQTGSGPAEVRLAGTDVLEFYQRLRPVIRLFQATPQAIPAGEKAVVSGVALRGSSSTRPLVGEQVQIWFDPRGSAPRTYRGSATTDDRGYFEKTLSAPSDGTWRAVIPDSDRFADAPPVDTAQETRTTGRTTHSGAATATTKGYPGGVRIIATDVVVGLDPVTVRFDAGVVGFGWARSSSNVWFESRRGEGKYPDGVLRTVALNWDDEPFTDYTFQSTHATARVSALMPAGVYDVGVMDQYVGVCTGPEQVQRGTCRANVIVNDRTITTMRVKRASRTSVSASSTTFTGPKTITLRGAVRKVRQISGTKAAYVLSPNTPVKLYFDPAGSRGPVYRKTVRTGSNGVYTTKVGTSSSGRWIAKYPGTGLQAASQRAVTITVK